MKRYILLFAIFAFAMMACTPETLSDYKPAEVPEGVQAYFVGVPSSIDLTDGDGTIAVKVYRQDTTAAISVAITSEADALFTVPTSASFAEGAKTTTVNITYDPAAVVADTPYKVTLTLADNTTPYGPSSCSFTASKITPEVWTDFAVATFTEAFWGEEHTHMIKYREENGVRYCIVKADETCDWAYDDGTTCPGGVWGTNVPFEFIWYYDDDPDTPDPIEIPVQEMGWGYKDNPADPVYLMDWYHYWMDMQGQVDCTFDEFLKDYSSKYPLSYYDGNGGFFFNIKYFIPTQGGGWSNYEFDVVAICEGFERKVDYNSAFEYSALYEGTAASMMFSEDGTDPLEFPASIRYNEAAKDENAVEYYIPDYFKAGSGLAFKAPAPALLEDGVKIEDVDNEQKTGMVMFGNPIYVNVKGGSFAFAEGSEFPIVTLKLTVYSMDKDGNITYEFGEFEDVITVSALGKDYYTSEDIVGLNKASYIGKYLMTFTDAEGTYTDVPVEIADGGQGEGGAELLKISNLSGYNGYQGFDDTIVATWNSQNGMFFIQEPECATPFAGTYNLAAYTVEPETEATESGLPLVGGYVQEDGVIALVGYPEYESYRGLMFYDAAAEAGLCLNYDYILVPQEEEEESASAAKKAVKAAERTINASNAVPYKRPAKNIPALSSVKIF